MELSRLEFAAELRLGSAIGGRGSISVAEKERFLDGVRKELGDNEGRC